MLMLIAVLYSNCLFAKLQPRFVRSVKVLLFRPPRTRTRESTPVLRSAQQQFLDAFLLETECDSMTLFLHELFVYMHLSSSVVES